ncbi:MAG: GGDEF domain-containing protein [Synergistaceae bacterium]|nr:GGDEF domain-containing protein [Synergistaceae bacterium]
MIFSMKELSEFASAQNKIFDIVRLVDVSMTVQYLITDDGSIEKQPYKCFAVWNKKMRCENCISAKAYALKGKATKFEFVDNDIYFAIASYVEVNGKEYTIEMVTKLNDETLFSAYGKNKFIETIEAFNRKLYIDSLTGAYNRCYYEEQLKNLKRMSAVAMIDVDDLKIINDTLGHAAGDNVLKKVVKTVLACVRSDDAVVRLGGDEFILVFQEISREELENRLEKIRRTVLSIYPDKQLNIKISVSIGAVYDHMLSADINELVDKYLYKAKESKNSIVIDG